MLELFIVTLQLEFSYFKPLTDGLSSYNINIRVAVVTPRQNSC